MKVGIVPASLIAQAGGRLDAEFYLGDGRCRAKSADGEPCVRAAFHDDPPGAFASFWHVTEAGRCFPVDGATVREEPAAPGAAALHGSPERSVPVGASSTSAHGADAGARPRTDRPSDPCAEGRPQIRTAEPEAAPAAPIAPPTVVQVRPGIVRILAPQGQGRKA